MTTNDWPHRLEGPCTVTWEDDASPKSGTCSLVRTTGSLNYTGRLDVVEWDGKRTPRGVLRFEDIELDVSSTRVTARQGDEPRRVVALTVHSHSAPRRVSELL